MAAAGAPDVTSGEHEGPAPQEISARGYVRSWEEVAGRGTTLSTLLLQQLKAIDRNADTFWAALALLSLGSSDAPG